MGRIGRWLGSHNEWWAALALLLLLGAVALVDHNQDVSSGREDDRQTANFIAICNANNVFKANDRVNVRQGVAGGIGRAENIARNDKLLTVINCKRTFQAGGKAVPFTAAQEEKFLAVVAKGRIPILSEDGGRVVGSREPEQGDLADF